MSGTIGDVVRKAVALALMFAIQVAGLGSPLVHLHPDDHEADHAAGSIHAHWTGHERSVHESDSSALDADEDGRAVFLNVFVAESPSGLAAPGLTPATFVVPVPAERAAHRGVEVVHSHDPPLVTSLSSRAPPSFPVLI